MRLVKRNEFVPSVDSMFDLKPAQVSQAVFVPSTQTSLLHFAIFFSLFIPRYIFLPLIDNTYKASGYHDNNNKATSSINITD
jgi:hypothetical protein